VTGSGRPGSPVAIRTAVLRDHGRVDGFRGVEGLWIERLGGLRNVIRQELIGRQLAVLVHGALSVLDVGCGQGTQAIRLASVGCRVTGVDPSAPLLGRCAHDAAARGAEVELIEGRLEDLDELLGLRQFDLVCAHGLLMYVDNRSEAMASLASRVAGHGHLSVTVRNAHALAMRPGLRGDWVGALAAFGSDRYVNELGVTANADRLEAIGDDLRRVGFEIAEWYGVRVFNDAAPADTAVPRPEVLDRLLEAEDRAGRRDPYRWMASQLHVIGRPGMAVASGRD
jgi:SAM-dependent methyltransferase